MRDKKRAMFKEASLLSLYFIFNHRVSRSLAQCIAEFLLGVTWRKTWRNFAVNFCSASHSTIFAEEP